MLELQKLWRGKKTVKYALMPRRTKQLWQGGARTCQNELCASRMIFGWVFSMSLLDFAILLICFRQGAHAMRLSCQTFGCHAMPLVLFLFLGERLHIYILATKQTSDRPIWLIRCPTISLHPALLERQKRSERAGECHCPETHWKSFGKSYM
jgi:hypothetical protein